MKRLLLVFLSIFISFSVSANWLRKPKISEVINDTGVSGDSLSEVLSFVSTGTHGIEIGVNKLMIENSSVDGDGVYFVSVHCETDLTGASVTCTLNIPPGAMLIGVCARVDEDITYTEGTYTTLTFSGGNTEVIADPLGSKLNDKIYKMYDPYSVSPITATYNTDVVIAPDRGEFSDGAITLVVYYMMIAPLPDLLPTPTPTSTPAPTNTPS